MIRHSFTSLNFLYIMTYKPLFHTSSIPFSYKWAMDAIILWTFHILDCDNFCRWVKFIPFIPSEMSLPAFTVVRVHLRYHFSSTIAILLTSKEIHIKNWLKVSHILIFSNFLIILHCNDTLDDRFESMTLTNIDRYFYIPTQCFNRKEIPFTTQAQHFSEINTKDYWPEN